MNAVRVLALALMATAGCVKTRGVSPSATPVPIVIPAVRDTAATPPAYTPVQLARDLDSMVASRQFRNAFWGLLVVNPSTGDTLYSHNAGKLLMPASNMKILTGAVALAQLGPEYRFATTIAARGTIRDSVLLGDLVVLGRGDPSVSDAMRKDAMQPLRDAADSLHARGLRRVTGSLTRAGNAFSDASLGRGWGWDNLQYPYAAGVDELLFNDGIARVSVRGGRQVGDLVTATAAPIARYPATIVKAETSPVARPNGRDIEVTFDSGSTARVVVSGRIREGDTVTVEIAYRDPGASYLAAFREALAERGVVVERGVDATDRPVTDPLDTLHVMQSPPLREILPAMMKPSQNQMAEALLKALGLERGGAGTADSGARVIGAQLVAWGAEPDGFIIQDGSGLSRHSYITPETIVRVLDAMRKHASFQDFYDALPIAGVDGTIQSRMRGTPAQGVVRAKTGTVDRVSSLSGYVTTADQQVLIFSMLSNNWSVSSRDARAMQDAIAIRLATLRVVTVTP